MTKHYIIQQEDVVDNLTSSATTQPLSANQGKNLKDLVDAKEAAFTKNTAFNKNFETTASNIKTAGTAAVGSLSTIARADHVHPAQTSVSGNAGTATKLATARAIDGVSFNGSSAIVHYGTCSTAAATAAKTVACTSYTLVTGSRIIVKFTVTNSAASPTLNVNSTGAKAIFYKGAAITASYLKANYAYEFVYDGTQYVLVGEIDTNTTYTLSSITGTLAVSKGGTGATTAANARTNLGAQATAVSSTGTLTVAGWSSKTQTISVSGVTASNIVLVSPAPASASAYGDAKIICSAQTAGKLTFTCDTVPTSAITVNVVIL